ncbi:MAG: gamma-glutamyl-phosphate reductase [Cyanobacteria bacterium P01_C01_bin.69]
MTLSLFDLSAALATVREATEQLSSNEQCSKALSAMGDAISQRQDDILEANTLDLEVSRDMALPELVAEWLKLTPERVQTAADILHRLAAMGTADPRLVTNSSYPPSRPLGIVGFIYEAFPDLSAITAGLCIRTGNAIALRGGSEASQTNQIIAQTLQSAITEVGLSADLVFLIEPTEVSRLEMAQCADIDLVIAHGRPSLVEQVLASANIPVIPSRMGNCYLYWSASGSVDQVYKMIVDSHTGTPDAVNRIEKVLLHEAHSDNTLTRLWNRLQESGFTLKADGALINKHALEAAEPLDWGSAYLKKAIAFRQVKNTPEAISWINKHSSGHADSIATADYSDSRLFATGCRSASLYINASPQFIRNAKHSSEIALGVSDRKGLSGGLIGIEVMRERQRIFYGD